MKITFPVPRMGKPELDSPVFYTVAVGLIIGAGLCIMGILVMPSEEDIVRAPRVMALAPQSEGPGSADISRGLLAGYSLPGGGDVTTPVTSRTSRRKRHHRAPDPFPATQKVLNLLDGLLVTHKYTPYFIIYNREVEHLQDALRELDASDERARLPMQLVRLIDDASYAHTKLRDAWKIKTNPLKTSDDLLGYLRSVRINPSRQPAAFRSIGGQKKKKLSAYESAVHSLIEEARASTKKAQEQLAKLSRSQALRSN